ncbi:MAG: siderophore-interacting protein [Pseudomonadota bacterium]
MLARLRQVLSGGRFGPAEVTDVKQLTPHMIRITLMSELIRAFSPDAAGGHFKLVVPDKHESEAAFEALISGGNFKSEMRTYTIRHVRPHLNEIDVDIVTHGDLGRVGPWAQRTQPGDGIVISHCGSPKLITKGMTRILAASDMTGFPALAAGLETLDPGVQVDAFVEILSEADRQPVQLANGIAIDWIVKSDPYAPSADLIHAMRSAAPPDDRTSVFIAGEFATAGNLRPYFKNDIGVPKDRLYVSSYWKAGLDEPAHKVAKAAAA